MNTKIQSICEGGWLTAMTLVLLETKILVSWLCSGLDTMVEDSAVDWREQCIHVYAVTTLERLSRKWRQ